MVKEFCWTGTKNEEVSTLRIQLKPLMTVIDPRNPELDPGTDETHFSDAMAEVVLYEALQAFKSVQKNSPNLRGFLLTFSK